MLKKKTVFLLLLCLMTFYADVKAQFYDEVVSLGSLHYGCQVAWQIESNGMRKFAYPFDWFHTSLESLTGFMYNKGVNFLDLDKIAVIGPYPGDTSRMHVIDLVYGISSYHDFFSSPPLANHPQVKAKYERRIRRFFDLLNSNKRILFVRQGLSREQVEYLDCAIRSLYPHLSYTILAVNDSADYLYSWGLERIQNFYLQQIPGDWVGDFARWKEILSQFHVMPVTQRRPLDEVW